MIKFQANLSNGSNPILNMKFENANLNPKYTFDTFVVGNNNKLAHSASLAVFTGRMQCIKSMEKFFLGTFLADDKLDIIDENNINCPPGEVYNPLYIYGKAGLGKTHLMHSIGRFILEIFFQYKSNIIIVIHHLRDRNLKKALVFGRDVIERMSLVRRNRDDDILEYLYYYIY